MTSPIEKMLADAICAARPHHIHLCHDEYPARLIATGAGSYTVESSAPSLTEAQISSGVWEDDPLITDHGEYGDGSEWNLARSVSILTYRIDILLAGHWGSLLAIECDGHEFHDRTKQQAAYDRARDRELLKIHIPTIRFTGSEIVHSAERCAAEAWEIALAMDERDAAMAVNMLHRDGSLIPRREAVI